MSDKTILSDMTYEERLLKSEESKRKEATIYAIKSGNSERYAGIPENSVNAICESFTLEERDKIRTFETKEEAQKILDMYLDCASLSPCNDCEDDVIVILKK